MARLIASARAIAGLAGVIATFGAAQTRTSLAPAPHRQGYLSGVNRYIQPRATTVVTSCATSGIEVEPLSVFVTH